MRLYITAQHGHRAGTFTCVADALTAVQRVCTETHSDWAEVRPDVNSCDIIARLWPGVNDEAVLGALIDAFQRSEVS